MKASGRTAQKGRRWLLQTFKCLRELLLVVAESQKSNLRRLRAAEAKCNELQHRWGPRAAAEDGRMRWTPRSAHLSSQEEPSGRRLRRTGAEHRAYTAHNLRKKRVVEEPQRKREIVTVSERPDPREWRLEANEQKSSRPQGRRLFWRPEDRGACRAENIRAQQRAARSTETSR